MRSFGPDLVSLVNEETTPQKTCFVRSSLGRGSHKFATKLLSGTTRIQSPDDMLAEDRTAGSINSGSSDFTFPTHLLTEYIIICLAGYGCSKANAHCGPSLAITLPAPWNSGILSPVVA